MQTPRATYRLQFTRDFGFADAARIAPYLAALGISHVYASPYLRARPGSTHGYDIVAHDQLNPELGSAADFARMNEAFAAHGLGQILDFVPNHMGVGGADNPLWLDVLEWGRESRYAGWFDIDWEPAAGYLSEKLLVPVLGEQYGRALGDGKLLLRFDAAAGEFAVWAYDTHKLPIHPAHYSSILGTGHPVLERLGDEFAAISEYRPQVGRRAQELKGELALLVGRDQTASDSLTFRLARLNGEHDRRAASSTRWSASNTGARATSASPVMTSTTAASSTSTTSPGCASSCRKCSNMRTSWWRACCARACSTGCASTTSTVARSGRIPAAAARAGAHARRRVPAILAVGREDPGARRAAAARLAGRGHHGL
jgi:hypothetical protein